MSKQPSRRAFLTGSSIAAGTALVAGTHAVSAIDQSATHEHASHEDYPREHAGAGGPVGSATDRGKLVPGMRSSGDPPIPIEAPDLLKLPYKVVDGVKEFSLACAARATRVAAWRGS